MFDSSKTIAVSPLLRCVYKKEIKVSDMTLTKWNKGPNLLFNKKGHKFVPIYLNKFYLVTAIISQMSTDHGSNLGMLPLGHVRFTGIACHWHEPHWDDEDEIKQDGPMPSVCFGDASCSRLEEDERRQAEKLGKMRIRGLVSSALKVCTTNFAYHSNNAPKVAHCCGFLIERSSIQSKFDTRGGNGMAHDAAHDDYEMNQNRQQDSFSAVAKWTE